MHRIFHAVLFLTAVLSFAGCDESLPPYDEPVKIFSAEMYAMAPLAMTYTERLYLYDVGGETPVTFDLPVQFRIIAVNTYEETFQGPLGVEGKIEVWPAGFPNHRSTIMLTNWSVMPTSLIDPTRTTLTMRPKDRLSLAGEWWYSMDGGDWVFSVLPVASEINGTQMILRKHETTRFKARATVQLFQHAAPMVTPEIEFTLAVSGSVIANP